MSQVTLENRAVLAVAGADAIPFLQGLITHDAAMVAPGRPLFAGLLSPQGKALFDFHLHAGDDGILIDVAGDRADALLKRLSMYKLRKAVTLARRDDLAVLAAWPEAEPADARLAALGGRWIGAAGSALAGAADYDAHLCKYIRIVDILHLICALDPEKKETKKINRSSSSEVFFFFCLQVSI